MSDVPLLEVNNISKAFDGVTTLGNISFSLSPGEVCGLLGENGAGKSVLIRILAGLLPFDSGEIRLDGQPVAIYPRKALQLGIHAVLHESSLIDEMSVGDNLFLRREEKFNRIPLIRNSETARRAAEMLAEFGCYLDVNKKARELTSPQRKQLELCKAFSFNPRVVILDEPAAKLDADHVAIMHEHIEMAKKAGVVFIFGSHYLIAVLDIADKVAVLNRGEVTGILPRNQIVDSGELLRLMLDRRPDNRYPRTRIQPGQPLLHVEQLTHPKQNVKEMSFTIKASEIVGVLGLANAERSAFAKLLFGLEKPFSGTVTDNGGTAISSPFQALRKGIAYVGDDVENSIFRNMSIMENITLLSGKKYRWGPLLRLGQLDYIARYTLRQFKIRLLRRGCRPEELSRGVLQKLIIARSSLVDSNIFIMNDPTKQLDIASKLDLYNTMNALVAKGKSILWLSSDINEIAGMCDRVIIVINGRIDRILTSEDIAPASLIQYLCGQGSA